MKAQLKKVIVELPEEGSLLAETEKGNSRLVKVVSKGPTCECDIEEGDTVVISGYAGVALELDDKKYLIMQQEEILAKI